MISVPRTTDDFSSHWLLFSIAAFVVYNTGLAVYNLYFHPLAKYPGPLLARISPWINFYHATTGKRPFWIWQCHQIYGDTFRYHPNGVFLNSPVAFHDVFNNKANIRKTQWYHGMSTGPKNSSTLTTTDKSIHARKRRILNSVFSDKAIRSAETFVLKHVDRWNELLLGDDGKDWGAPRNFAEWVDYLVLDILGDLAFGRSFETKEPQDNPLKEIPHAIAESLKFINPILQSPFLGAWIWMRARGLNYILDQIRPQSVRHFRKFLAESVTRRIEVEKEQEDFDEENKRKDMLHYLLQAKDPETGATAYSNAELLAEANLLVVAGSDTTSIILTGLFFSLSRNERVYNKLVKEIRSAFKSVDEIRNGTTIHSCHYLRACIDEAMRFSPTGASEMPREAGRGGVRVNGEFFPEGTRLSIAIWSFFRNEENFKDPHVYRPERWIVNEEAGVSQEDVTRAQTCFFPFSQGPYNCVGKNLAILELLVTVARTLHRMDIRALPGNILGECRPELGWGQRDRKTYEFTGDYLAVDRKGPMLQFRKRQD